MSRAAVWRSFISTLQIRTRDRRLVPLHYTEAQDRLWDIVAPKIDAGDPIRVIILKARRLGMSTAVESWLTTFVSTMPLVNALVMAHEKDATKRIWDMSRLFRDTSPVLSKVGRVGKSGNIIRYGDSTLQIATAGSPESQRSADITAFHGSEVAFWRSKDALLATLQTIPSRAFSIAVLESTANGKDDRGELFYHEWQRASEGDSDFLPVFFSFLDFEEYRIPEVAVEQLDAEEDELVEKYGAEPEQLAWRRWAIKNLCQDSLDNFHQEYPHSPEVAFVASGLAFFSLGQLKWFEEHLAPGMRITVKPDGTFRKDPKGEVEMFRPPVPGRSYVIGAASAYGQMADVTRETTATRSTHTAQVLDMETQEQMAEYESSAAPHIQAGHLAGLGRIYHNALIAPEVHGKGGGGGREMIVYLRERFDYWNLHQWRQVDRIRRTNPMLYGWETNARTRPRMIARVREVVMEQSAVLHSRRLLRQLRDFGEHQAANLEAMAGQDDLLMAWGVALMSRSENYSPTFPQYQPDFQSLGIRVLRPESPQDRLHRILRTPMPQKALSFLEG